MNREELLKPRIKIIASWPGMEDDGYEVGKVICAEEEYLNNELVYRHPHLFKRLGWWEDRNPEDMPQYVDRVRSDGDIEVLRVLDPKYNDINQINSFIHTEIKAGCSRYHEVDSLKRFYSTHVFESIATSGDCEILKQGFFFDLWR